MSAAAVEACDLAMTFPATRAGAAVTALRGLDLTVAPGEVVALVGPNGAGKTTLLRLCLGLLARTAGALRVAGLDPEADGAGVRARCGAALGGAATLSLRLTALDNVAFFARLRGLPATAASADARRALADAGVDALADRPARLLSAGQRQRVALARAFVGRPDVLLLDEPTRDLDEDGHALLAALFRARAAAGCAVVLATHDHAWASALGARRVSLQPPPSEGPGPAPERPSPAP